jgi:hypothetical protein
MNIPPEANAQMLSEKTGMKEAFGLEKKGKGTVWMESQSNC